MAKIFELKQNGTLIHSGCEDGCYFELQRRQSQSASHALKYSGYSIEEKEIPDSEANEILKNDRWRHVDVTLLEDLTFFGGGSLVKIRLQDGTETTGNKNAIRYSNMDKGATVSIMQGYISR